MTAASVHPSPPDDSPHDDGAEVAGVGGSRAWLSVRPARAGALVDAYPSGTHDLEVVVQGEPTADALRDAADAALRAEPRSRRVVIAVAEGDVAAIERAESAGFRYVVDVDTRVGAFSLMVREPAWVAAQPQVLDDIPLSS